jgi:hypothetical protein
MDRPRVRRRVAACTAVGALALAVAAVTSVAAPAARGHRGAPRSVHGHTIFQSPELWATIDVCNSPAFPHVVGVRGSIPGSGLPNELMYMRFQLQYTPAFGVWVDVGPGADSGFLAVGSSTYKARQAGRNFTLNAQAGSRYVVRGVVTFEWRRRGHVVRNAQKQTTAGHVVLAGADPPGYSAAACALS